MIIYTHGLFIMICLFFINDSLYKDQERKLLIRHFEVINQKNDILRRLIYV